MRVVQARRDHQQEALWKASRHPGARLSPCCAARAEQRHDVVPDPSANRLAVERDGAGCAVAPPAPTDGSSLHDGLGGPLARRRTAGVMPVAGGRAPRCARTPLVRGRRHAPQALLRYPGWRWAPQGRDHRADAAAGSSGPRTYRPRGRRHSCCPYSPIRFRADEGLAFRQEIARRQSAICTHGLGRCQ